MEPPVKKARVFFGSFEEQEKKRLEQKSAGGSSNGVSASVQAGINAGNINIGNGGGCALFRI